MVPYKAVLAFFVLLSLNSSFVFADDDFSSPQDDFSNDPINLDDTSSHKKVVADKLKVNVEDLRPKGTWSPAQFSFPKVTLAEQFPSEADFAKNWKVSKAKKNSAGTEVTEDEAYFNYNGKWALEEPVSLVGTPKGDYGLVLKTAAAHSAISRKLSQPLTFEKSDLVVIQYEVKIQGTFDCAGLYMKLLSASKDFEQDLFSNSSPYTIMFGPDKCGATDKVHFIFRHKNKLSKEVIEHHLKAPPHVPPTDKKVTNLYTLLIEPSKNKFEILIDNKQVKAGSLLEDFTPPVVPPKQIPDPKAVKPADWVDQEKMVDPDAKKPEDWDEDAPLEILDMDAKMPEDWLENEHSRIRDPEAKRPDVWNDKLDGEWEPIMVDNPKCKKVSGCGPWKRPMKRNPAYKGKWHAPMISNPAFKGKWEAPIIDNPDYIEDTTPGFMTPIGAIGFELWSMHNNTLFDNIFISNKVTREQLKAWTDATFKPKAEAEAAILQATGSESDPSSALDEEEPLSFTEQFQLENLLAFFQMAITSPLRAWAMYPIVSVATLSGSFLFVILLLSTMFTAKKQVSASSSTSSKASSKSAANASATGMKKKTEAEGGAKLRSGAKKGAAATSAPEDSDEKENMNEESE